MTRGQALALAAAVILAGGLGYLTFSLKANADFPAPQRQDPATDDAAFGSYHNDGHPGRHLCAPKDHHSGYTYTPHRYPRVCGGEITAVIHRGFAPMRIPQGTPDGKWIIDPPSEVMY